jgi:hypothetical protein
MNDDYVPFVRSIRFVPIQINDDHFRRKVYIGINRIIHKLDVRFDEVNMELFSYVVALNPSNSFVLFDAKKVCRLA